MLVKTLFKHFDGDIDVVIYENADQYKKNIFTWNGIVNDLKGGSEYTYAYCKVYKWYVNEIDTLEIILQ